MWFGLVARGGLLMVCLMSVVWRCGLVAFGGLVLLVVDDCYVVFGRGFVFWGVDMLRWCVAVGLVVG